MAGLIVKLGLMLLRLLLPVEVGVRLPEVLAAAAAAAVGGTPIAVVAVVLVLLVSMMAHRLVAHGGLTKILLLV